MADTRELDFSPYFDEDESREYALDVLEDIAETYDLDSVKGSDAYVRRGFLSRIIPGSVEFGASVEGTSLRYNTEIIDEEDVSEAVDARLEESRQDFTSWKALSTELGPVD
jgi:hypothetical protein